MFNNILPLVFQNMFNNNYYQQQQANYINSMISNLVNQMNNVEVESLMNFVVKGFDEISDFDDINIEIQELNDSYIVKGFLPNIKKSDINLEYDEGELRIHIRRKEVLSQNNGMCMSMIQINNDINKKFNIMDIEEKRIVAVFKNNVLKIILPKKYYEDIDEIVDVVDYVES